MRFVMQRREVVGWNDGDRDECLHECFFLENWWRDELWRIGFIKKLNKEIKENVVKFGTSLPIMSKITKNCHKLNDIFVKNIVYHLVGLSFYDNFYKIA